MSWRDNPHGPLPDVDHDDVKHWCLRYLHGNCWRSFTDTGANQKQPENLDLVILKMNMNTSKPLSSNLITISVSTRVSLGLGLGTVRAMSETGLGSRSRTSYWPAAPFLILTPPTAEGILDDVRQVRDEPRSQLKALVPSMSEISMSGAFCTSIKIIKCCYRGAYH